MRNGRACLLVVVLSAGCGKKEVDVRPAADAAANDAPTSCVHARNARVYAWREEPLEVALDVELDWTCPSLADDKLELIDTDIGAKLGDRKSRERYRVDADGSLAAWDDPFLLGPPRLHGLFVYSVPRPPSAVGLRYGDMEVLPGVLVTAERPRRPPKPSMRVVATSSEPGREKGTSRLTALIELDAVSRSAGRSWKVGGTVIERTFFFAMTGDAHDGIVDGEHLHADRVLDVDEKAVPVETPVASLPVRPAKRFVLAQVSATRMKRIGSVSLSTGEGELKADAAGAAKLVLTKATRTRLDTALASVEVARGR